MQTRALKAPHWSIEATRTLEKLHSLSALPLSLSVYAIVYIMNRSQAVPSLRIGSAPGRALAWLHTWLYGASAVIH